MPLDQNSEAPRQIGPYRVVQRLGAGAMGEVYLGVDGDGREAAVKLMAARLGESSDFVERFEREIEVVATVQHPSIARALGWGEHEGRAYLAMELVRGPSLDQVIKKTGPLPELIALHVIHQVARGLEHAYLTAGLIHRDIKPANILIHKAGDDPFATVGVDEGDVAKLIDFGLAKSVSSQSAHALTMTGAVMGTPHYMSPEQIRGDKQVDLHADIYALGATLHHLLTGSYPYPESSPGLVMTAHLTKPVPDPGTVVRTLNRATRELVQCAMAKKPGERHLTWRAFIAATEQAIKAVGGTAKMPRSDVARAPQGTSQLRDRSRRSSLHARDPASSTSPTVAGSDIRRRESTSADRKRSSDQRYRPQPQVHPTTAATQRGPALQAPRADLAAAATLVNPPPAAVGSPGSAGPTSTRSVRNQAKPLAESAVMRGPPPPRTAEGGIWQHVHWIAFFVALAVVALVVYLTLSHG